MVAHDNGAVVVAFTGGDVITIATIATDEFTVDLF